MAYQQPYYNGGYYPQYQNGAMPDMLNQYKGQYQQPIPQMQQNMAQPMQQNFQQMPIQTPTQQKPNNDMMIWVQGSEGAKGYLVAPNNTVVLWDTESPTIYVKSADASGVPSMRVLDFTERNANTPNSPENAPVKHECKCGDKFATKEQINALQDKIDDLEARLTELAQPIVEKPKAKTTKKGDVE